MKERPILFSAPMVRALLDDTKTQTRRIVKTLHGGRESDDPNGSGYRYGHIHHNNGQVQSCPCGQPGDRLIVARAVEGFPLYCAGTNGRIYSKARGEWRPLSQHGVANGYPCVTVMDAGRKTTRNVHTLVCSAFYGPAPFPGAQVRHLDGNELNSAPENLAWGTQEENWRDRRAHGNGIEGEKHHAAKLDDAERASLRWAIQHGLCSQRHAARTLRMTQSAVGQIMKGAELEIVQQDIPAGRIPNITLEIVSVRVERLQDISEADAMAEGIDEESEVYYEGERLQTAGSSIGPAKYAYRHLWESLNGAGSWESNQWVWVVEFRRLP